MNYQQRNEDCYAKRKDLYGADRWMYPRSEVQQIRFEACLKNLGNIDGRTILDLGCGIGDLAGFLEVNRITPDQYVGADLIDAHVSCAAKKHDGASFSTEFFTGDPISDFKNGYWIRAFDYVVMLGVLTNRACSLAEAEALFLDALDFCYSSAKIACAITTVSTYQTEMTVNRMAFDPTFLYQSARRLSERVMLDTTYAPYDQMVLLFKEQSPFRKVWNKVGGWDLEEK